MKSGFGGQFYSKEPQNVCESVIWIARRGKWDRRGPAAMACSRFEDCKRLRKSANLHHFFMSQRSRFVRDSGWSQLVWLESTLDRIE